VPRLTSINQLPRDIERDDIDPVIVAELSGDGRLHQRQIVATLRSVADPMILECVVVSNQQVTHVLFGSV
jgi:hypothetical protein